MSDTLVIRQGWFPLIRWGLSAAFFTTITLYAAFFSADAGEEPGAIWIAGIFAGFSALVALRRLWLKFCGRPEAVLSPEGLRARACDSVLIPWELVTSVSVDSKTATVSLDTTPTTIALEETTRHAVYDVILDKKVREIGVKHSENLSNIGFKLVPTNLTASSSQIGRAFARFLPAERCRGFAYTGDPTTTSDFARRGATMAAAIALEAKQEADAEQAAASE